MHVEVPVAVPLRDGVHRPEVDHVERADADHLRHPEASGHLEPVRTRAEHPADEVRAKAEAFIAGLPALFAQTTDEQWQTLVGGVRAKLIEADKSVAERGVRLFDLAYNRDGDWTRREETLAALDHLTKARVEGILNHALDPQSRQVRTFLGFARQHEPAAPVTPTFDDRAAWKKTQQYQ